MVCDRLIVVKIPFLHNVLYDMSMVYNAQLDKLRSRIMLTLIKYHIDKVWVFKS